jgi:anti-sigma factor RsiW
MIDLPSLWREQQHATFPPAALRFVAVDARAGALLTASLRGDGVPRALPPEKREELRRALDEAVAALAELRDVESRAYFERLIALGNAVLTRSPGACS